MTYVYYNYLTEDFDEWSDDHSLTDEQARRYLPNPALEKGEDEKIAATSCQLLFQTHRDDGKTPEEALALVLNTIFGFSSFTAQTYKNKK